MATSANTPDVAALFSYTVAPQSGRNVASLNAREAAHAPRLIGAPTDKDTHVPGAIKGGNMFSQTVDPIGNLGLTCLVALIPVVFLLVLLAVFRVSAWLAVLLGSIVTFVLAAWVWHMPFDTGIRAYLYGSATGVWNVDWITFWGLMLFNTLGLTGLFENLRRWLISQARSTSGCRRCCSPGRSAPCSRAWSASAIPGPWWRRS